MRDVPRILAVICLVAGRATAVPSFVNEVMPVISKSGCNGGGCHGNQKGKGRLKLSLWGDLPKSDHLALRESPRLNNTNPQESLILRKPTLNLDHEGGKRFGSGSEAYRILSDWIAAGTPYDGDSAPELTKLEVSTPDSAVKDPDETIQLTVTATFSDGSERDVTKWAVYETSNLQAECNALGRVRFLNYGETSVLVRYLNIREAVTVRCIPASPGFAWSDPPANNYIDRFVFKKLRRWRSSPVALCDDATFIRRATLDITGLLPTADEARRFVDSKDPEKRTRLADTLLQRPEFAEFWAVKWADLLRVEEKVLDRKGVAAFYGWIRDSIAEGKPLDRFAGEILAAEGSTYKNPPANFYRALRDPTSRAEAAAQVFLGTRLQCAKCHNHPYERWTQDDYYQFAAVFDGLDYKIVENKRRDKLDKHQFIGEQLVQRISKRVFNDPRTGKPPAPSLLDSVNVPDGDERFHVTAEWIGGHDLFAKMQANRIWFHLMGRGLVNPVDDFRVTNPSSHPGLLEALAHDLRESRFDLRTLIRRIVLSRTYQTSSQPGSENVMRVENYACQEVRRLSAEQLVDSLHQVMDVPARFKGYPEGTRAAQLGGVQAVFRDTGTDSDRFLRLLGKPGRLLSSDVERSSETTLAQVFALTGGGTLDGLLTRSGGRLDRLVDSSLEDENIIRRLFWTTLTRAPSRVEVKACLAHLQSQPNRRVTLEDIVWGLVNAKEFLLRR